MADRTLKHDLTGSDETLEALLARLRSFSKRRPMPGGRHLPPDFGRFVTSRRPRGGAGGAEAPLPTEHPAPDLYAPA
jgi:hypothetical protein